MTIHPARAVAGLALAAAGFVVGVAALAVLLARLLVGAGMPDPPRRPRDSRGRRRRAAVRLRVRRCEHRRRRWPVHGHRMGAAPRGHGFGRRIVAGSFGLFLMVAGRDPFASPRSVRAYTDGVEILATFTVVYLVVIGLVAVARQPIRRIVRGAA